MNKEMQNTVPIARVNTVLVYKSGTSSRAVVSTVVAKVLPHKSQTRIRFVGPVKFNDKSIAYLNDVVWSIANVILKALGSKNKSFEISIVNLEAASALDLNCTVGGYSADVAVLLALLSASLQFAIPMDSVVTGHIASTDGDIRIVKEIPAKIKTYHLRASPQNKEFEFMVL